MDSGRLPSRLLSVDLLSTPVTIETTIEIIWLNREHKNELLFPVRRTPNKQRTLAGRLRTRVCWLIEIV